MNKSGRNTLVILMIILAIVAIFIYIYLEIYRVKEPMKSSNKYHYFNFQDKDPFKGLLNKYIEDIDSKYDAINFYYYVVDKMPVKEKGSIHIQYSAESIYHPPENFDINLIMEETSGNVVKCLYAAVMMHLRNDNIDNNLLKERLLQKLIPKDKFCLFLVSNGNCFQRNRFFDKLSNYKKVDSYGKFKNNMGGATFEESMRDQYKFTICFENFSKDNYFTEKLLNGYAGKTIPIYWGCKNVAKYVNMNSMLYLEPEATEEQMDKLIKLIIQLDKDPILYESMYKNSFFNGELPDDFKIETIQNAIKNIVV